MPVFLNPQAQRCENTVPILFEIQSIHDSLVQTLSALFQDRPDKVKFLTAFRLLFEKQNEVGEIL